MAGRVNERTASIYTGQLVDENGSPINLPVLITLTLTLYDEDSGAVLNGRDSQNVLNTNNVTVSLTGLIVWAVQELDNVVVNPDLDTETHVALFQATYNGLGGVRPLKHEFRFRVVNLAKVA